MSFLHSSWSRTAQIPIIRHMNTKPQLSISSHPVRCRMRIRSKSHQVSSRRQQMLIFEIHRACKWIYKQKVKLDISLWKNFKLLTHYHSSTYHNRTIPIWFEMSAGFLNCSTFHKLNVFLVVVHRYTHVSKQKRWQFSRYYFNMPVWTLT